MGNLVSFIPPVALPDEEARLVDQLQKTARTPLHRVLEQDFDSERAVAKHLKGFCRRQRKRHGSLGMIWVTMNDVQQPGDWGYEAFAFTTHALDTLPPSEAPLGHTTPYQMRGLHRMRGFHRNRRKVENREVARTVYVLLNVRFLRFMIRAGVHMRPVTVPVVVWMLGGPLFTELRPSEPAPRTGEGVALT